MGSNIIFISEMRVGSRWLHYLLADLLVMKVSPEIDRKALQNINDANSRVQEYFRDNRIVKFHHVTHEEILESILKSPNSYKIIGIVRNPRDRIVSLAFHQRFKPPGRGLQKIKQASSDLEAVKLCFYHDDYGLDTIRMFEMMEEGQSTMAWNKKSNNPLYIWTTYEWMIENPRREISKLLYFFGIKKKPTEINRAIVKNSFGKKSGGRARGEEDRQDEWRRKGVNDDYLNWFDKKMIMESEEAYQKYLSCLENEERKRQEDNFV